MQHDLLKFFINSIEIQENPDGWESLMLSIKHDKELKGTLEQCDASLTFYKDGYDLILGYEQNEPYSFSVPFEIRQYDETIGAYIPIFVGLLFIRDVTFGEGEKGYYAKCKIEDNSFFAKIYNNRNIECKIYAEGSKNGETITPAQYEQIRFHEPSTGTYYGLPGSRSNTGFKVYELLRYLIAFMTDGTVDFRSTTFGSGGIYENYMITNGYICRFANASPVTQELFQENWPGISFSKTMQELNKAFNVGFVVGFDGARPYVQVESYPALFDSTIVNTFSNVQHIERSQAQEYLYSEINTGSDLVLNEPTLVSGPADISFLWFKPEQYIIQYTSNNERVLDIRNSWIIDSNMIEDFAVNGQTTAPTTYDKNIVLLQVTPNSTWFDTVATNWISAGASTPLFFNEGLNTNNKVERHLGGIPNSLALQLGTVDNTFIARSPTLMDQSVSNPGVFNPVDYTAELSDPGGNYDPANKVYICPTGGVYTFAVEGKYSSLGAGVCAPYFDVYLDVYASGDTPGVDPPIYSSPNISPFDGATTTNSCNAVNFILSHSLNLSATDKVAVRIITYLGNWVLAGSLFKCTSTEDGSGIYKTVQTEYFRIGRNKFEYPITASQYKNIKTTPIGLQEFYVNGLRSKYGWIEDLKYKPFGNSQVMLISSKNINQ